MKEQEACEEFTLHPVRKLCQTCRKPREDHPFSEEDVESMRKFIKAFTELPEIKKDEQYAWTPPLCPDWRVDEYFSKFKKDKVPKHTSVGQKNRLKRIAFQIPLSDLSVENCRFVDPNYREDYEEYVDKLQNTVLRIGTVKEWAKGMAIQCPKCLLILEIGELVVASTGNGGQVFHPACFVCFQCAEPLVDLIHCADIDGTVFCVRHYSDNTKKRCHTCDELIFASQFALSGETFYHKEHLLCFGCDELLDGTRGFTKAGEIYCAKCYEDKFCSECIQCQKKITVDSKHVTYREKNWHYECFTCAKCEILLSNIPFEVVDEKFFCSNCYNEDYAPRCKGCEEIFDTTATVVKYEENIYHVPCFKCVDCEETIGTGPFVPHKGRVYCRGCHLRNFGVRCFRCKYGITDDRGIMYNKQPYHEDCFTCFGCQTKIASRPFKTVDDNWYCMNCYSDKFCKKCHTCEHPILLGTDQDILYSYQDYRWHAACFICSLCKNSLADRPFMMREKVLLCKTCLASEKAPAATAEEVTAATAEQGETEQELEPVAS